jgi:hypothetical protein
MTDADLQLTISAARDFLASGDHGLGYGDLHEAAARFATALVDGPPAQTLVVDGLVFTGRRAPEGELQRLRAERDEALVKVKALQNEILVMMEDREERLGDFLDARATALQIEVDRLTAITVERGANGEWGAGREYWLRYKRFEADAARMRPVYDLLPRVVHKLHCLVENFPGDKETRGIIGTISAALASASKDPT